VLAYIEYELIQLTAMLNFDSRLTLQKHQIQIVARELYEMFPNESIEDVHLCFRRGATGMYDDKLLRLDIAVLCNWMRKYLDEKAVEAEKQLMAEKETYFAPPRKSDPQPNPDRNLLSLLKVVVANQDK